MLDVKLEPKVFEEIDKLEKLHDITVIFAVDAGSRSYGCSTESSDHDIRFVFVHNDLKKYITVTKLTESIVSNDHFIDLAGWNITKTIVHLKESNPSIIEWLSSPIVYINKRNFRQGCLDISKDMHSHLSLMYHYFHMAQNNWKTWIEGKTEVICKKYFYVIRPLSALMYIMDKYNNKPDEPLDLKINFDDLIDSVEHLISEELRNTLKFLVEKKRHLTEKELCPPITIVNEWITNVFDQFESLTKKDKNTESDVDFKIQSTIKIHRSLVNEAKKVKCITSSCGFTARSNYLTAIGLTLQLLWLNSNPLMDTKSMPGQIHQLLKTLTIDELVMNEIKNTIDDLKQEEKTVDTNIDLSDVYSTFVKPGLQLISKDMNTNVLDLFDEKSRQLIENPKRNDYAGFVLTNFIELLWLLANHDETQSSIPKEIINIGDKTNTIPRAILERVKLTISELKPKYIVEKNDILDKWFEDVINLFTDKVKQTQEHIMKIREMNAQKRLSNSIKNIDPIKFDDLLHQTLQIK